MGATAERSGLVLSLYGDSDGAERTPQPTADNTSVALHAQREDPPLRRRANLEQIQADRQARLFEDFTAIHTNDAWQARTAGFLPSSLVQASLPYRDPGNIDVFVKTSGNVSLLIVPGHEIINELVVGNNGVTSTQPTTKSKGYPYGSIPRLLLAWLTTQAITTKSRQIQFGKNLSQFMAMLGIHNVSGGDTGSIRRLRDQTARLLSCRMSLQQHKDRSNFATISKNLQITSLTAIYDSDTSNTKDVFGSVVTLDYDFYNELLDNPVPLDFRALQYLRHSPLSLDLYVWLTWTMFKLSSDTAVSWSALYNQFGSSGSERKFRENAKNSLAQVLRIYSAAKVKVQPGGLFLSPSPTHVPVRTSIFPSAAIGAGVRSSA